MQAIVVAVPKRSPRYWLFKSEPTTYSFANLMAEKGRRTHWDGVRNFQARNLLRDEIKTGDGVLFYHSSTQPMAIVGIAKVVKNGYPDHTAFDPKDKHYDPKSDPEDPSWYMVDIAGVKALPEPLTRDFLKDSKALAKMMLLRRGARLSVQPVTAAEWRAVMKLAGV